MFILFLWATRLQAELMVFRSAQAQLQHFFWGFEGYGLSYSSTHTDWSENMVPQYPLANHHVPHVKTSCNEFAGYTAVSSFKQSHDMRRIKRLSVLTSSPRLLSSLRPSLRWKPYTRCCPRRTRPTMRWPSRMCGRQRWPFCCRWGDGSRRISETLPLGSDAWEAWMLDAEMKIDL